MTTGKLVVAGGLLLIALGSHAGIDKECTKANEPTLCAYEPNTFGLTKDSYARDAFLDVNLSLKYQLFPNYLTKRLGDKTYVYLAMSTRFGQYIGSKSAPVIGKRFNPKLFGRIELDEGRVDVGYAHESNGQSIDTAQEFQSAMTSQREAEFARDYISRGWDYLEFELKRGRRLEKEEGAYWYGTVKYFIRNGLLQGRAEEYNDWEGDPEGKPRKDVHGLSVLWKYIWRGGRASFTDAKVAARYETGYHNVFKYNTIRVEAATKFKQLPLNLWVQNGYSANLAYYYKRLSSWGLEVQIGGF
jgi:hypothetical protein